MTELNLWESLKIRDIWAAKKRIEPIVKRTPVIQSKILSEQADRNVFLKLENVHEVGAFKIRGAANKILSLTEQQQKLGVTTYSTGNHGMAVAFIAEKLGMEAVVCISNRVPKAKVDSLRRLGAHIEVVGSSQDDASARCFELEEKNGMTVIEPFDDPYIIAGQGTIGLELIEELPGLSDVVVPLSGGGLLSGIALALKSTDPDIRVTGVSMEQSAVMYESLRAGKPISMEESGTLADSLLGGIGLENRFTFGMVRQLMDKALLVSEAEIASAMCYMIEHHRLIIEGAAATGVAAVMNSGIPRREGDMAVIISGHNVGFQTLLELMQSHQLKR